MLEVAAKKNDVFGEFFGFCSKHTISHNKFLTFSYKFRVMNLALPNVMRVLRTRYDMIALLLQAVPKAHHNLPQAIITHNSPQAIIVD